MGYTCAYWEWVMGIYGPRWVSEVNGFELRPRFFNWFGIFKERIGVDIDFLFCLVLNYVILEKTIIGIMVF